MITIIDYDRGNLFSLCQALRHLGAEAQVTANPEEIAQAERLILPGVGAFGDGMDALRQRGLIDPIHKSVAQGTPLLGICLGMQLMASRGEEFGDHAGLDLIPGTVRRLPKGNGGSDTVRIPNVGWRRISAKPDHAFLADLPDQPMAYFVHSFAFETQNPNHTAATIRINDHDIPAAVQRDNLVGNQFHPEKSSTLGLELVRRFLVSATAASSDVRVA